MLNLWGRDSESFALGIIKGREGTPYAEYAVERRLAGDPSTSIYFAQLALEIGGGAAWMWWFENFTGRQTKAQ